jgi:hypothetical protein
MLSEIFPTLHAEKIRKPLMVIQGAKDPRVVRAESMILSMPFAGMEVWSNIFCLRMKRML